MSDSVPDVELWQLHLPDLPEGVSWTDVDLTEVTEADLDALGAAVDAERERRRLLAAAPTYIVDTARAYIEAGGDLDDLNRQIEAALAEGEEVEPGDDTPPVEGEEIGPPTEPGVPGPDPAPPGDTGEPAVPTDPPLPVPDPGASAP
ncbi:MAG: hypothetical protein Q3999_05050 [Buchananella hordeovulneris]|nr:hypothetical protein [Buchananella hordeovulneris]